MGNQLKLSNCNKNAVKYATMSSKPMPLPLLLKSSLSKLMKS